MIKLGTALSVSHGEFGGEFGGYLWSFVAWTRGDFGELLKTRNCSGFFFPVWNSSAEGRSCSSKTLSSTEMFGEGCWPGLCSPHFFLHSWFCAVIFRRRGVKWAPLFVMWCREFYRVSSALTYGIFRIRFSCCRGDLWWSKNEKSGKGGKGDGCCLVELLLAATARGSKSISGPVLLWRIHL